MTKTVFVCFVLMLIKRKKFKKRENYREVQQSVEALAQIISRIQQNFIQMLKTTRGNNQTTDLEASRHVTLVIASNTDVWFIHELVPWTSVSLCCSSLHQNLQNTRNGQTAHYACAVVGALKQVLRREHEVTCRWT